MRRQGLRLILLPLIFSLSSCGGGGGGGGAVPPPPNGGSSWQSGVFRPASTFADRCMVTDENNYLRSRINDTYLWFDEVTDRDPAGVPTLEYFELLKSTATTLSGADKDKFHFTYDTDEWIALSQGGVEAGYGAEFAILTGRPPRRIVVAFTQAGSPAASVLSRGDEIVQVDGVDAINGDTQAIVNTLNDGLFPSAAGQNHTFQVRNLAGALRTVAMTSANVTGNPVPTVSTFATSSGPVGYLLFTGHIATAEGALVDAIETLDAANVTDLILDLRYNGGGYLDMASQLAYMIGNTTLTAGQTFERIEFNSKHTTRNPITGETLTPTPFHNRTLGFQGSGVTAGQLLPSLNLNRVYVITGPGTCSASESIINGLRGVDVQVFVIGSTTCGKPYGFYPDDNCDTTYFYIQFRGENADNFGDYTDGFSPANQTTAVGTPVPGCSVGDDFTHQLGDPAEFRIAAALSFRASNNLTCPTASGVSFPRLSKQSLPVADQGIELTAPAWSTNRILRR